MTEPTDLHHAAYTTTHEIKQEYIDELEDLVNTWPLANILPKLLASYKAAPTPTPTSDAVDASDASGPVGPVIAVVGAYKGKVIDYLSAHETLCNGGMTPVIVGYEPQTWAIAQAVERLVNRPNITLNPYGLSTHNIYDQPLYKYGTDACTVLPTPPDVTPDANDAAMSVGDFKEAITELSAIARPTPSLPIIDLLIVNIEGGEFELLPYIFNHKAPFTVKILAVQFHTAYSTPAQLADILYTLNDKYPNQFDAFLTSWGLWWQ